MIKSCSDKNKRGEIQTNRLIDYLYYRLCWPKLHGRKPPAHQYSNLACTCVGSYLSRWNVDLRNVKIFMRIRVENETVLQRKLLSFILS